MGSTAEFRRAFVTRLKQACDESSLVPPPHKGRQNFIAEKIGVAPEAVSKWFKGVAMPRPDKLERLAELLGVDQSWLAFGVSLEMSRTERKAHSRNVDGAVMLVMGMLSLAGGHCGAPSDRDPRREYVDFYVTLRGSVYPVHVAMAREISKDQFEVNIPKEYTDVRVFTVISLPGGKYHFLDLPLGLIEKHKVRKSGQYIVTVSKVDANRYLTGSDAWPRIKNFMELS